MTTATGNAYDDGAERRGWLIGHFIDPETSPLHSTDVEIKWGDSPGEGGTPRVDGR